MEPRRTQSGFDAVGGEHGADVGFDSGEAEPDTDRFAGREQTIDRAGALGIDEVDAGEVHDDLADRRVGSDHRVA